MNVDLPHPDGPITAKSIMFSHLVTIVPDATAKQATRIMNDVHIHMLLILPEKGVGALHQPVWVLSASGIVREVARVGQFCSLWL